MFEKHRVCLENTRSAWETRGVCVENAGLLFCQNFNFLSEMRGLSFVS